MAKEMPPPNRFVKKIKIARFFSKMNSVYCITFVTNRMLSFALSGRQNKWFAGKSAATIARISRRAGRSALREMRAAATNDCRGVSQIAAVPSWTEISHRKSRRPARKNPIFDAIPPVTGMPCIQNAPGDVFSMNENVACAI